MKHLLYLLLMATGLMSFTPAPAPLPDNIVALKMDPKITGLLLDLKNPVFTIDKQGILRPQAGFIIQADQRQKAFLILRKGTDLSTFNTDKHPLPGGGTFVCGSRRCDECEVRTHDVTGDIFCRGCENACVGGITGLPGRNVAEVETANGNWVPNDLR